MTSFNKHFTIGVATLAFSLFAAVFSGGPAPALAQDRVNIQFERGATSTTINGTIRGDEYIDYVLNARGGQMMVVSLGVTGTNGNGSAFFNILPAGQDFPALYNGSTDDDRRAEVTLPESGEWAIRVYLMGNDRDAGKTVGYSMDVYIAPGSGGGSSAGSGSGSGPLPEEDFFVVRLSGSDGVLNVRDAPRASAQKIGEFRNGVVLRNIGGCTMSDGQQWCKVQASNGGVAGWVAARFLALPGPGGDGGSGAQATQLPSASRMERVQFSAGRTGTEFTDQLAPGTSVTYVLGARNGQELYFRLAVNGPNMSWRLYNPDGSLLDQASSGREYRGQLWQSGDHKIEVTNAGNRSRDFNIIIGID